MGKSTLAKKLHGVLGWKYVARDDIKERLAQGGCPQAELGQKSYDILWRTLKQGLAAGTSVISDTNLNQPIALEHIQHIVTQTQAQVVVLACFCDTATHKERLESRKGQGLSAFWIDSWEKYQAYLRSADNQGDFEIPHPTIQVDTGKPVDINALAQRIQSAFIAVDAV